MHNLGVTFLCLPRVSASMIFLIPTYPALYIPFQACLALSFIRMRSFALTRTAPSLACLNLILPYHIPIATTFYPSFYLCTAPSLAYLILFLPYHTYHHHLSPLLLPLHCSVLRLLYPIPVLPTSTAACGSLNLGKNSICKTAAKFFFRTDNCQPAVEEKSINQSINQYNLFKHGKNLP